VRKAALTALLLLPGCAGTEPRPKIEDIPRVSAVFEQQLVARRKADGVSVRIYNAGSVTAPGGAVSDLKSWAARTRLDIPVFLIKHPIKGYALFDAGLHPDMETMPAKKMGRLAYFFLPFKAGAGQNIVAQLAADGIKPEEIKHLIISHLHMDHVGMIDAFPKATVHIDRREWEEQTRLAQARPAPYLFDPLAMEAKLRLRLVDLSTLPAYASFDHAEDFFKDGTVYLLDLSGHTAGNMGLWINLDSGPIVLTGDASWILDNHQDLALPLTQHIFDLKSYWRRLYQLQEAQKALQSLVIFPGHDLTPLKLQPRPDVTLAPYPR
jgi:glyoxylase-like metal-dependent hydrolase (beta-lactamase superfamily II)